MKLITLLYLWPPFTSQSLEDNDLPTNCATLPRRTDDWTLAVRNDDWTLPRRTDDWTLAVRNDDWTLPRRTDDWTLPGRI